MVQNCYQSGQKKAVPAVLVYVRDQAQQVLMVHRGAKSGDVHAGKYNGLGGKLDFLESPRAAAAREVSEECGLNVEEERYVPLGYVTFPNFKPAQAEDWLVYIFSVVVTDAEKETIWKVGPEGDLAWFNATQVLGLPLWAGDRTFLPRVLEGRPVFGTIWYECGEYKTGFIQTI